MKKLILYASLFCLGMASCSKDFLVPEGELPEWLGESIYEELRNPKNLDGTFNTYLRLIDDLGYQEVLSKTGSKTIFPANDEAFAEFFKDGNNRFGKYSYEELTASEKAQLLYSSMLDNAVLVGNLSTQQNSTGDMLQGKIIKHPTNISLEQSVVSMPAEKMPANNKYFADWKNANITINALFDNTEAPMVHFSGEYLLNNAMTVNGADNDFYVLTGSQYSDGDAYVFDRKVLKSDVACQNGYIHQLDGVLVNPGNMAQILRDNQNTKYISRMLDYFAVPMGMPLTFNTSYQMYVGNYTSRDSVFAIRYLSKNSQKKKFAQPKAGVVISDAYLLDFDPGWNYFAPTSTADEQAEIAAFLVPTDDVIEEYFCKEGAYIVKNLGVEGLANSDVEIKNHLNEHLDAIYNNDPAIFASMLNNIMKPYLSKTVPSKFSTVQNDAFEFLDVTKDDIQRNGDKYDVTIANNGVIYKMNKFFAPKIYNAVLGPASVYTDMRIMGAMLNDHQTIPGTPSTLGADMYYYLLSMKSSYALFVPTDNEDFYYIDPASKNDIDGMKALRFIWDPTSSSSYHILVQRYLFDPETSSFTVDPNVGPVAIEKGYFNTQLADMLNYHTVVLPGGNKELYGNKYYLTKHGGAIYVPDGRGNNLHSSTVCGGSQIDGSAVSSKVTEVFGENSDDATIENGSVYRLDRPIQPTVNSVYDVLSANSKFNAFFEFCSGFDDEELLTFAGILDGTSNDTQKKKYVIFGENNRMNMLGTYNYTLFVPENMEEAYERGLPRWEEVRAVYENAQDENDEVAQRQVKEMIDKMHDFVLYHIQSNSVFSDVRIDESKNQTFMTDQLGIAKTLNLIKTGGKVCVNDAAPSDRDGLPEIVDANIFARDITTEPKSGTDINNNSFSYKSIVSSSFVVIHGINKPLCYNSSYAF